MSYPVEPAPMYGLDGKPCARVDLKTASAVDNVSIDDIVTITVTGKVKSLRGRDEYKSHEYKEDGKRGKEVTRVNPGSIEIEVSDLKVTKKGDFDGMLEE